MPDLMLNVAILTAVLPNATAPKYRIHEAGNTKGGGITVPFTSCLTGLD
jgi:hypothetical protein